MLITLLGSLIGNTIFALVVQDKEYSLLYWVYFLLSMVTKKAIGGGKKVVKAIAPTAFRKPKKDSLTPISKDAIRALEMDPLTRVSNWAQQVKDAELQGQKEWHEEYNHLEVCGCQLPYCSTDKPEGWDKFCTGRINEGEPHSYNYDGECVHCRKYSYDDDGNVKYRRLNEAADRKRADQEAKLRMNKYKNETIWDFDGDTHMKYGYDNTYEVDCYGKVRKY